MAGLFPDSLALVCVYLTCMCASIHVSVCVRVCHRCVYMCVSVCVQIQIVSATRALWGQVSWSTPRLLTRTGGRGWLVVGGLVAVVLPPDQHLGEAGQWGKRRGDWGCGAVAACLGLWPLGAYLPCGPRDSGKEEMVSALHTPRLVGGTPSRTWTCAEVPAGGEL